MEIIIGIFVVIGIINLLGNMFNGDNASSTNTSSSAPPRGGYEGGQGSGGSGANMGRFEVRANQVMRGSNKDVRVISIQGRGLLPVHRTMEIQFVTWAEDITDDSGGEPVFCSLSEFRHHENPTFQCVMDKGSLSPNHGFGDWVELGVAPLDALAFPRSGTRNIRFYCYMTEKTSPSLRKSLLGDTCYIRITTEDTGYKEWKDELVEALTLSMRLGVAMAHADGEFARNEATSIKDWLKERVDRLDDDEQAEAKAKLNAALRAAVAEAATGSLDVSKAIRSLRASPIRNAAYDALELCTIIMSADGVISTQEMTLLREIGDNLGISEQDIQGLTDKHTPEAVTDSGEGGLTDELLVGLDIKLPPTEIKRKLRETFARYNSLLTTERDQAKRLRYQECIEAVARLRKKYG